MTAVSICDLGKAVQRLEIITAVQTLSRFTAAILQRIDGQAGAAMQMLSAAMFHRFNFQAEKFIFKTPMEELQSILITICQGLLVREIEFMIKIFQTFQSAAELILIP